MGYECQGDGKSNRAATMDQIGHQLVELFWGALPTAIIVFLFILFMRWSFWTPFQRVLEQRDAATAGARKSADETLARAGEKVRQYEETLRQVRADIYREQDAARRQALDERARTLTEVREKSRQMIQQARDQISAEVAAAKKDLETEAQRLAGEIARSLLEPAGTGSTQTRENA